MYVVHYFENKNPLLTRLVQRIPELDEPIKIKGRKGKVSNISHIDEKNVHVQIVLELKVNKKAVEDTKKRRR